MTSTLFMGGSDDWQLNGRGQLAACEFTARWRFPCHRDFVKARMMSLWHIRFEDHPYAQSVGQNGFLIWF